MHVASARKKLSKQIKKYFKREKQISTVQVVGGVITTRNEINHRDKRDKNAQNKTKRNVFGCFVFIDISLLLYLSNRREGEKSSVFGRDCL